MTHAQQFESMLERLSTMPTSNLDVYETHEPSPKGQSWTEVYEVLVKLLIGGLHLCIFARLQGLMFNWLLVQEQQ